MKLNSPELEIPKKEMDFFLKNVKTEQYQKGKHIHVADKICKKNWPGSIGPAKIVRYQQKRK